MKTRWWALGCVMVFLVFTSAVAPAKDNHDRGNNQNHGQEKKRYRQFNNRQRQRAQIYYNQHRNDEGFRHDDRWNNDYENRLRSGYVLDDDMRRMSRPAPYEMTRGFGRAPRGYRYVIIGGHVVMVDEGYRVHDSIRFEINLGH